MKQWDKRHRLIKSRSERTCTEETNAIGPAWKENTYGKHLRIKIDWKCLRAKMKLGLRIVTNVKCRPTKAPQRHWGTAPGE
jgi:hypothetical protein